MIEVARLVLELPALRDVAHDRLDVQSGRFRRGRRRALRVFEVFRRAVLRGAGAMIGSAVTSVQIADPSARRSRRT